MNKKINNKKVNVFLMFYIFLILFPVLYLTFIKFIPKPGLTFFLCCSGIILILFRRTKKNPKKESNLKIWLDIIIYLLFIFFAIYVYFSPKNFKYKNLEAIFILILWILNFLINGILATLSTQSLDNQSIKFFLFILILSVIFIFFDLSIVISACLFIYSFYKKYLDACKQKKINIKQIDYKLEQIEYYSITLTGISVANSIVSELFNHFHKQKTNNFLFVYLNYLGDHLINNSHSLFIYYLNSSNIGWLSSILATMCIFIIVLVTKLMLQGLINAIVKNK